MRSDQSKRTRNSIAGVVAGAVTALFVLPAPALAGPTEIQGGGRAEFGYTLTAAPGTTNNLTVTMGTRTHSDGSVSPAYVFSDPAGLTTGLFLSCTGGQVVDPNTGRTQGTTITCTAPTADMVSPGVLSESDLKIDLGDRNDTLVVANGAPQFVAQQLDGGAGNDTLTGSNVNVQKQLNVIRGGPGNDGLRTGGVHALVGQGGNDKLFARNGVINEFVNCGPGKDKKESATRDRKDGKPTSC